MLAARSAQGLVTLGTAALFMLALVPGCVSPDPATLVHSPRERLLGHFEAQSTYESHWRAAQLCAELADQGSEQRERSERESFARRGMEHAERAVALQEASVEGHYYRALCVGRFLSAERLPTFSLVSVLRDEGERAAQLDPRFECSGAHRLLGSLYSEAPSWGPGGVGDDEKADQHFQAALRFAGDCPENHLAYARHLLKIDSADAARDEARKALSLIDSHPGLDDAEKGHLRAEANELLK